MSSSQNASAGLKPGIYFGAGISAMLLLLPYIKVVFVPAFVLGPLAGVWFEIWRTRSHLSFMQGALLGFDSAFYGGVTAIALEQIASHLLHEQLSRTEKLYELPSLIASKGLNNDTPTGWYLSLLLITIIAIFAGGIGAPSGILGVKLFQRPSQP